MPDGSLVEKLQPGKDSLIRAEVIGLLGKMYFKGLGYIPVRFCRRPLCIYGWLPGAGGGVAAGCGSGSRHHAGRCSRGVSGERQLVP